MTREEVAYRNILRLITDGALTEGARLPSEAEMARSFGISRPVVRQALTRLKEAGVIDVRWGAGSYVRDVSSVENEPSFGPVESLNEVRFTYELRYALEGEAAALAARRRAPLDAARQAFDDIEKSVSERSLGLEGDLAFHFAIAAASQNPYFERMLRRIRRPLEFSISLSRTLSLTHREERLRTVQKEHLAILDAIAAGDPEAARAAVRCHIENACRRIFQGPGDV
jgi:DNA-binding FadR family transcriptional regulator